MDKELIKKLKQVKQTSGQINPDRAWVVESRGKLMSQISNTVKTEQRQENQWQNVSQVFSLFLPKRTLALARPIIMVFMAISLAFGGWVISARATESLPGDYLWNVKLATEKAQVLVTGEEAKPNLHLEFAKRRVEEAKQVKSQDSADNPERVKNISKAIKSAKKSVESAKKSVEDTKEKKKDDEKNHEEVVKVVETAKSVNEKAGEITVGLEEIEKGIEEESIAEESTPEEVSEVKKDLAETKEMVDDAIVEVIKTAVEAIEKNKQEGNTEVTKEEWEVKEMVAKKVEEIAEKVKQVGERMDKAQQKVDEAEKIKDNAIQADPAKENVATSTILEIIAPVEAVTSTTKLEDTRAELDEMEKKVTEVKEQVAQDNVSLIRVVENIQTLNKATADTLGKVKTVENVVKEILPQIENSGVGEVLGEQIEADEDIE